MANPHQPYAHPGASYYHSPPPPPQQYYSHGPAVPYYPYPMNSLNGHSPPPHQPVSPRVNGGGRGGYQHPRAGGPSYQYFPHVPPQHYLQPQPMPQTTAHPQNTYSQHPQKYPPHVPHLTYTTPYQPHLNAQHSSSWSTATLSPLPKQLSMPAQLPSPLPPTDDSPVPSKLPEPVLELPVGPPAILASSSSRKAGSPLSFPPESAPPPASPSLPTTASLEPTEQPEAASTSVSARVEPMRPSTPHSPTTIRSTVATSTGFSYVIWSRRPRNPSRAVGVMISSLAQPPSYVVEGAAGLRTPPSSPKTASSATIESVSTLCVDDIESSKDTSQGSPAANVDVPSSSATEATTNSTAPVTPLAGSPASPSTSVTSAAASPTLQPKSFEPDQKIESPETIEQPSVTAGSSSQSQIEQKPEVSKQENMDTSIVSSEVSSLSASHSAPQPPLKKSWASLLQSGDSSASSSRSGLPTSSRIGISIPAGVQIGPASSTSKPAAGAVRPEVLTLLTSGPSGLSAPPKIRPRGLINTGNMCFANAVLQILVYCPPFWRLFTELGKYIPNNTEQQNNAVATPLVSATIQFLKEFGVKEIDERSRMSRSKGKEREEDFDDLDSFIPTNVYDVMKEKKRFASMVGGHQEDAEEFLGFFLDTLEEELLSLTTPPKPTDESDPSSGVDGWLEVTKRNRAAMTRATKAAESPITRMFGGKFRSTLKAPHQRDSITVEDWRSLRLDIQREQVSTIKDALQYISHSHAVEITSPTRPGVVIEAQRQELIEALPPILILHLKRFLYDTSVGDVVKIGKHVTFSPDLEIGPDLQARRPAQSVKYQLFGALYHHGNSASGGHYTLDVLHPNRDMSDRPRQAWIRIDDELVSDVRPEDVFGGQERDDRCAYLLFYRRLGPGIPTKTWSQTAK